MGQMVLGQEVTPSSSVGVWSEQSLRDVEAGRQRLIEAGVFAPGYDPRNDPNMMLAPDGTYVFRTYAGPSYAAEIAASDAERPTSPPLRVQPIRKRKAYTAPPSPEGGPTRGDGAPAPLATGEAETPAPGEGIAAIPMWAWLVGGLGVFYLFSRK